MNGSKPMIANWTFHIQPTIHPSADYRPTTAMFSLHSTFIREHFLFFFFFFFFFFFSGQVRFEGFAEVKRKVFSVCVVNMRRGSVCVS